MHGRQATRHRQSRASSARLATSTCSPGSPRPTRGRSCARPTTRSSNGTPNTAGLRLIAERLALAERDAFRSRRNLLKRRESPPCRSRSCQRDGERQHKPAAQWQAKQKREPEPGATRPRILPRHRFRSTRSPAHRPSQPAGFPSAGSRMPTIIRGRGHPAVSPLQAPSAGQVPWTGGAADCGQRRRVAMALHATIAWRSSICRDHGRHSPPEAGVALERCRSASIGLKGNQRHDP
jgi:hypothetical protein